MRNNMNAEQALAHITDECHRSGWTVDDELHAEASEAFRGLSTYVRIFGVDQTHDEWLNRIEAMRKQVARECVSVRPALRHLQSKLPHTMWGNAVFNIISLHLYKLAASGLPSPLDLAVHLVAENRMEMIVTNHAQGNSQRHYDNEIVRAAVLQHISSLAFSVALDTQEDVDVVINRLTEAIRCLG